MDIESKIWGSTNTGMKLHAFINGKAICHGGIKAGYAFKNMEGGAIDWCQAQVNPCDRVCPKCTDKFNAAIERAEYAMEPSTGEGDYLPPAEDLAQASAEENAAAEEIEEPARKPEITTRTVVALRTLRNLVETPGLVSQLSVQLAMEELENTGIFAAIDAVSPRSCKCPTGMKYHAINCPLAPGAEQRISKCTCPAAMAHHLGGCPGDPEEWGDMAYYTAEQASAMGLGNRFVERNRRKTQEAVQCGHCRGDYKLRENGLMQKHNCSKYDPELRTHVYGPLDRYERFNKEG